MSRSFSSGGEVLSAVPAIVSWVTPCPSHPVCRPRMRASERVRLRGVGSPRRDGFGCRRGGIRTVLDRRSLGRRRGSATRTSGLQRPGCGRAGEALVGGLADTVPVTGLDAEGLADFVPGVPGLAAGPHQPPAAVVCALRRLLAIQFPQSLRAGTRSRVHPYYTSEPPDSTQRCASLNCLLNLKGWCLLIRLLRSRTSSHAASDLTCCCWASWRL